MDDRQRLELEAAVFRDLVEHLRHHTDVQNIDLMNLAGFCRNCLSKWYVAAAEERGMRMTTSPRPAKSSTACRSPNGKHSTRPKPPKTS